MSRSSCVLIMLCILLLAGCSSALNVSNPSIVIEGQPPDQCFLAPGDSQQATYSGTGMPEGVQIHWRAGGPGEVLPADGPLTTISVPPGAQEGASVTIDATFSSGGQSKTIQRFCLIRTVQKTALGAVQQITEPVPAAVVSAVPDTPTAAPAFKPTRTFTPTIEPCLCAQENSPDTFRCLIQKEANAADAGNLDMIALIFARDAKIFRGDDNLFYDARAYYQDEFKKFKHSNSTHTEEMQVGMANGEVYWTSGSSTYVTDIRISPTGEPTPYNNMPPSDHWVFSLDERSCWVVKQFEINAAHLTFPPPQTP